MKRCIFYLPYELPERGDIPSSLRPRKMIQAFENIGYDVFVICGRCSDRKKRIKKLKYSIKKGDRYEFMYTESSTIPTLLTESHHYPTHPFVDFNFFKYVKNQGIKIGLFYRDITWKTNYYRSKTFWKQFVKIKFYEYDIRKYEKNIDRFYVPNLIMADLVGSEKLDNIKSLLLPGSEETSVNNKDYSKRKFHEKPLNIFYAGGTRGHYCFTAFLKAVSRTEHCVMTLCLREREWIKEKERLEPYLSKNIRVIHKHNDELEPYYQDADIGVLFYENNDYMNMAIPFKSFEYLAHEIPAIATTNTAIGEFIEKNGTGWVIPYNADAACELLNQIIHNPEMISEKQRNCAKAKQENLWTARARTVERDLCSSPQ